MIKKNVYTKKRGNVRVDKLPYRWDSSSGPKTWPVIPGYKNINVCSGSRGIYKELSPMLLGPIPEVGAQKMENLWQFSKVIKDEVGPDGKPTQLFFDRQKAGFANPDGKRRKAHRSQTLFHYWNGKILYKVDARKQIYCKHYAELVVKTDAYKALEELLNTGTNVQLLGYDGHDYSAADNLDGSRLLKILEDTSRPWGHEFVLAGLLSNKKVWQNGFANNMNFKLKNKVVYHE
jgi:hypothetical protein